MQDEKGSSLLEVIVALLILALISASVFTTIANVTKSTAHTNMTQSAGSLAASLMEITKRQPYATSYTPDSTLLAQFPGYSANIDVAPITSRDGFIQKISVAVTYNSKTIITLEGYKRHR